MTMLKLISPIQRGGCDKCIISGVCPGTQTPFLGSDTCYPPAAIQPRYSDEMTPGGPNFWRYWDDVDGLQKWQFGPFLCPDKIRFPHYVTMVKNGSRRNTPLDQDIVAIPFFRVFGRRKDRSYGSRFADGDELRARFKLRRDTLITLVGVNEDPALELFWQEHRVHNIFEELSRLNVTAVTVPNFSIFEDMNQFDAFRNIKRMLQVADRFSK